MEIIIRECRAEDARAIHELNHSEMGYDYPLSDTEAKLRRLLADRAHRIYIAVADGRIAGYIHACDYELLYAPPMKNIMGIAVSGEYKRLGIGSALMRQVEGWAAQTGAQAIRLVSGESRTAAHEFYRSQGYSGGRRQLNFRKQLSSPPKK